MPKRLRSLLVKKPRISFVLALLVALFLATVLNFQKLRLNWQAQTGQLVNQIRSLKTEKEKLDLEKDQLLEAYQQAATDEAILLNEAWENAVDLYQNLTDKYTNYKNQGVEVKKLAGKVEEALESLLGGKYEALADQVNETDKELEKLLTAKLAEEKTAAEEAAKKTSPLSAPVSNTPGAGHSRITVATERGSFVTDIVLLDLGQVRVVTVTGNDGNCNNNCAVKPLSTYVAENSGFAGINGTYFCPPDYDSCAGKMNSYDFPVYSSAHAKWINDDKLFWGGRAMMAFIDGSAPRFCQSANSCGSGGISAGIVNYPALVTNSQVIVDEGSLPDSLKNMRGYRGAIGVRDNWLYLMIVRGATVPEVAYVMKALSIQNGMNLDGGGSSALYYNGYRVGPGRALPNALIIRSR